MDSQMGSKFFVVIASGRNGGKKANAQFGRNTNDYERFQRTPKEILSVYRY
jgi:hypothetical protein